MFNHNERFFLIDCAEGTQVQLRKFKVKFGKLNYMFLSHLHGDHTFGFYGLVSSLGLLGREQDLHVYAGPGTIAVLQQVLKLYELNLPFKIIYHPLDPSGPGVVYSDNKLEVLAFPVRHRVPTWGFLFREIDNELNVKKEAIDRYHLSVKEIIHAKKGNDISREGQETILNSDICMPPFRSRSYAFISDTLYLEGLKEIVRGVDLLYHEATYKHADKQLAQDTFHSTAHQAALMAEQCQAGKLIIGHFSARYKDLSPLLQEAREVFPSTVLAKEGEVFKVDRKREG